MDEHKFFRLMTSLYHAVRIAQGGQSITSCPHCKRRKVVPVTKFEDILIVTCTDCEGVLVPFAGELLPLNASIAQTANEEEQKFAIVQAIMKWLFGLVRQLVYDKSRPEDPVNASDIPDALEDLLGDLLDE